MQFRVLFVQRYAKKQERQREMPFFFSRRGESRRETVLQKMKKFSWRDAKLNVERCPT